MRRLSDVLDLITSSPPGEKETRAWTLRRGQSALDAASTIHTDIARGFIRCEVIRWDDLVAAGSHAEAARRGLQRLEGKTYVVAGRRRPEHSVQRLAAAVGSSNPVGNRTWTSLRSSFHRRPSMQVLY